MELNVFSTSNKSLCKITVEPTATVGETKTAIAGQVKKLKRNRQSLRADVKGKDLKDDLVLSSINIRNGTTIYVKDLGPQVGWRTVFLLEYFGPFVIYLLFAARPSFIYSNPSEPFTLGAKIALVCWSSHYAKRLYETVYVHRFSHGTMPLRNLFRNCAYYWGFAAYVAVHVNHPLFTQPSLLQMAVGTAIFVVCELGNLSVHLLFRDLRPKGTTVRRMPVPNKNPLTKLFNYVSCPNYTYEYGAWIGFTILTSCVPALIFAMAGMYQMTLWAIKKHSDYKKEFKDYPKQRKAILPFII